MEATENDAAPDQPAPGPATGYYIWDAAKEQVREATRQEFDAMMREFNAWVRDPAARITPGHIRCGWVPPGGATITKPEFCWKSAVTGEYVSAPMPLLLGSHAPVSDSDVPRPTLTVEWSK